MKTINVKVETVIVKYYAIQGEEKGADKLTNASATEMAQKREEMGAPMDIVSTTEKTTYKVVKEIPQEESEKKEAP